MTRGPNLGGMPKAVIIRREWREHMERMDKMRSLVFDLLSHPDATDEQIAQVRQCCIDTTKRHRELRKHMIEKGFEV